MVDDLGHELDADYHGEPDGPHIALILESRSGRNAIREALAFGKAVYDQRRALGLSPAELAGRADMTVDQIECIEEGGTEPTIALLRRLAAAVDAHVRLTAGHDLGSVWFEPHAA